MEATPPHWTSQWATDHVAGPFTHFSGTCPAPSSSTRSTCSRTFLKIKLQNVEIFKFHLKNKKQKMAPYSDAVFWLVRCHRRHSYANFFIFFFCHRPRDLWRRDTLDCHHFQRFAKRWQVAKGQSKGGGSRRHGNRRLVSARWLQVNADVSISFRWSTSCRFRLQNDTWSGQELPISAARWRWRHRGQWRPFLLFFFYSFFNVNDSGLFFKKLLASKRHVILARASDFRR